ncbi:hypothetical protein N7457_004963 [Penicillium paradoxum]|uniref:uncharacterized protein n=1 Tax=Penicillium paradoxum TaxID=176176 RepID=UPI002547B535|nr:uncharacterized protein N7457_004963 [Penicillium paradoxum]KAJ5783189.1 hypothetical protein N7457_004963 [Penicillium paradoxum]
MDACVRRHADLCDVMNRIQVFRSQQPWRLSKFVQSARIIAREKERKVAFDAFRDSVLLLRDLASEVRLNQQLVDMSASIAQIMFEYADRDLGESEDWKDDSRTIPYQHEQQTGESHHRRRSTASHRTSNFTRDIELIVRTSMEEGSSNFNYVPARAKLDTGCDENLVSLELLRENGIDESLLSPIQQEIALEGLDSTFFPEFEVELSWYQGYELKKRTAKFYVVKKPPFNILIGSKGFGPDFSDLQNNHALFLAKRSKTPGILPPLANFFVACT